LFGSRSPGGSPLDADLGRWAPIGAPLVVVGGHPPALYLFAPNGIAVRGLLSFGGSLIFIAFCLALPDQPGTNYPTGGSSPSMLMGPTVSGWVGRRKLEEPLVLLKPLLGASTVLCTRSRPVSDFPDVIAADLEPARRIRSKTIRNCLAYTSVRHLLLVTQEPGAVQRANAGHTGDVLSASPATRAFGDRGRPRSRPAALYWCFTTPSVD